MFCPTCGASLAAGARFCLSCGAPAPGPASVPAAAGAPSLAGIGDRLVATILDGILFAAVYAVAGVWVAGQRGGLTASGFSMQGTSALLIIGAVGVFAFLYYWLAEGLFGATLGKAIVGIRVVRGGGDRCGLRGSLIRNLLRIVDGIGVYLVGAIVMLLSKRKQRAGDHAAGTLVVHRSRGRGFVAAMLALWVLCIAGGIGGAVLLHRNAPPPSAGATAAPEAAAPPAVPTVPVVPLQTGGTLALANFRFLTGRDGPPRPALPYKPGENVFASYDVTGFGTGPDGAINLLFKIVATDQAGTPLHRPWQRELVQSVSPGQPVNGYFNLGLPSFVPSGEFKLDIEIEDRVKSVVVRYAVPFQVEGIALVPASGVEFRDFAFSLARDGAPENPPVLTGGGTVYLRWKLAGLEFRGDAADVRVSLEVAGPEGKVVLQEPEYVVVREEFVYHPAGFSLPMSGHITLPGSFPKGTYTAKLEAVDRIGGASAKVASTIELR